MLKTLIEFSIGLFEVLTVDKIAALVYEEIPWAVDEGPRARDKAGGVRVAAGIIGENPCQFLKG
jgi:hypothetical protein